MPTESFIKDFVIKNEKDAIDFVSALEKAEANKNKKKINIKSRELTDKEEIKKLFKK